jgi:hypothetical protein
MISARTAISMKRSGSRRGLLMAATPFVPSEVEGRQRRRASTSLGTNDS